MGDTRQSQNSVRISIFSNQMSLYLLRILDGSQSERKVLGSKYIYEAKTR